MAKSRRRSGAPLGLIQPLRVDVGKTGAGRGKPPLPTRHSKQRLAILAALYHAGFSYTDIATQTGLSRDIVRRDVAQAEKEFRLADRLSKVMMRLDSEAVPLAVDNLIATLESTDAADRARKDDATYRTLEGRGLFRQWSADDGARQAPAAMALQVNFAAPPGLTIPVQTAQIVGASREVSNGHRGDGVRTPETSASAGAIGTGFDGTGTDGRESDAARTLGRLANRPGAAESGRTPELADFVD